MVAYTCDPSADRRVAESWRPAELHQEFRAGLEDIARLCLATMKLKSIINKYDSKGLDISGMYAELKRGTNLESFCCCFAGCCFFNV